MAEVHVSNHPLILHKLTQLRDKGTEHREFRELLREISSLLAYEATRDIRLKPRRVETPLATTADGYEADESIGLVPILRAGIGMADGFMAMIPNAQIWHLGMYRDKETLQPVQYYSKLPDEPTVQICIVLDPILATGGTAIHAVNLLKEWGIERVKYMGLLSAPKGIEVLHQAHPDVPIHLACIDDELTEKGYVLPGLGDSGDRQFGT